MTIKTINKTKYFDYYLYIVCIKYVPSLTAQQKNPVKIFAGSVYSCSKLPGIVKIYDLCCIWQITRTHFLIQPQRGTPRPDPLGQDITHPSVSPPGGQNAPQAPPRGFLTPTAVPSTTTVGVIPRRTGGASTWGSVPTPPSTTPPPEAVNITRLSTVVKEKCHLILVSPLRNPYIQACLSQQLLALVYLDYSYIVW